LSGFRNDEVVRNVIFPKEIHDTQQEKNLEVFLFITHIKTKNVSVREECLVLYL
jgi:hypothetical protein